MPLDQIVKKAKNKKCYKTRLEALNELKKDKTQIADDIILKIALEDRVFLVRETAFRMAEARSLTRGGKPLVLAKKNTGYKVEDFRKAALLIRRRKKLNVFELESFKALFEEKNPEMYDVMLYDQGENFDAWLEDIFKNAKKK